MNVLVIGATGPTGIEITKQALAQGHRVAAFVRKPAEFQIAHAQLVVAQGDVLRPETLDSAMSGQDAVLCSLGTGVTFKHVTLFSEGTENILASMKKNGVRRVVCITGIGAGDSRGHGGFLYDKIIEPTVLRTIYEDKDRQEQLIKLSGLDWVIVRPGVLTNESPRGNYKVLTNLEGVTAGKIARADVAAFVVAQLTSDAYLHQTPLLTY